MTLDMPTIADFLALLLAAFFVIKGFVRGFLNELFGFLGLIVGFMLIWKYSPNFASMLKFGLNFPDIAAYIIAIALIFIVVNVAASFLGRLVKKIVYFGRVPMIDKILGSLCGLCKASIVLILFYLAFELAAIYLGNGILTWMDQSKAMMFASNVWNYLSGWLLKNGVINYLTLPNLIAKVHMR